MGILDEIGGLPTHPLAVHAPIVIVPLATLLALIYAALPGFRRNISAFLLFFAVTAPATAWFAVEAGKRFAESLGVAASADVQEHQGFGENVMYYAIAFGVVGIALAVVDHLRYLSNPPSAKSPHPALRPTSIVLSVGLVLLGAVMTYYAVRAGHSGATLVWSV